MHSILNAVRWLKSSITDNMTLVNETTVVEYLQFTSNELAMYIKLLDDDPVIKDLLNFDACNVIADKYLLAISFVYFIRAGLDYSQYDRQHFFAALYLAHEMEEDDESMKNLIIPWAYGTSIKNKKERLREKELELWKAMEYRTLVSKQACEQVISSISDAKIWLRFRPECHSGAYREGEECHRCKLIVAPEDPFQGFMFEDDLYEGRQFKRAKLMEDASASEFTDDESISDVDIDSINPKEDYETKRKCVKKCIEE